MADWGKDNWWPNHPQWPSTNPTPPLKDLMEFQELVKRVEELEKRLGIDCPGNEHKQDWINELRDKLDEIEKRISP